MFRPLAALTLLTAACLVVVHAEEPEATGPTFQRVVARGVGKTADEATKDALRNAVYQAVGAALDTETLVQNDQVIKDEILTYSDGFVKKFEPLGPAEEKDGLIRVTVLAMVERRSLDLKIAKAKESFRPFDGQGLAAKLLKEYQDAKDLQESQKAPREAVRAMVEKTFEGFPLNLLEAYPAGEPTVVKKEGTKVTLQLKVIVRVNPAAYDKFSAQVLEKLDKLAVARGNMSLIADVREDKLGKNHHYQWNAGKMLPALFDANGAIKVPGKFMLAVNTRRTKANDRTEWKCLVLDDTARHPLAAAASCLLKLRIAWVDAKGEPVFSETVPAKFDRGGWGRIGGFHAMPLRAANVGAHVIYEHGYSAGFTRDSYNRLIADEGGTAGERVFLLSPLMFETNMAWYTPEGTITRTFTIEADDLKSVDKIKCELFFEDNTYREMPPKVKAEVK